MDVSEEEPEEIEKLERGKLESNLDGTEDRRAVGRGNCKPFSPEIVAQLKNFWSAGMVGVGEKRYGDMIKVACAKTGLTQGQVKVCNQLILLQYVPVNDMM